MKKITLIIAVYIFFLLIGCAPRHYVHPTKNADDFIHDKYDCEKIAEQYATNKNAPGNPFMIVFEQQRCLQAKFGWKLQEE